MDECEDVIQKGDNNGDAFDDDHCLGGGVRQGETMRPESTMWEQQRMPSTSQALYNENLLYVTVKHCEVKSNAKHLSASFIQ